MSCGIAVVVEEWHLGCMGQFDPRMSSTTTYIPSVRNVHPRYMDRHQLRDHVPRVYISIREIK